MDMRESSLSSITTYPIRIRRQSGMRFALGLRLPPLKPLLSVPFTRVRHPAFRRNTAVHMSALATAEEADSDTVVAHKTDGALSYPMEGTLSHASVSLRPWDIEPTPHPSSRDARDGFELSVAPMMKCTDFNFHYLMRQFTRRTRLYTEMVVDDTILHQLDNLKRFLGYNKSTHPLTVQLGGNNPEKLAKVAKICEEWGFEEIDLNVGCPSPRVSRSCFGARLMLNPEVVRDCCTAMRRAVSVPVTVKCRLGADNVDKYEDLVNFVKVVNESGVTHYIVHARKCHLDGLNPAQNRSVPPLMYDRVYRLAADFPENEFSINGGILTLEDALAHRRPNKKRKAGEPTPPHPLQLRGVMVGRGAWNDPFSFADADRVVYGDKNPGLSRRQAVEKYLEYAEFCLGANPKKREMNVMARPLVNLFNGDQGCRGWRRFLNDAFNIEYRLDFRSVILEGIAQNVPDEVLDRTFPVE